jgi:hypothetical protein
MTEDNLCILQQKLNNLIKIELQAFDDALQSSNAKDAKRGFPYPTNTREKTEMTCERIRLLSTGMISILKELHDRGVFVIESKNMSITMDTVVTMLNNEVERIKTILFKIKRGFTYDGQERTFAANALMIDNTFEISKDMIVTEIDILMRAINSLPPVKHNAASGVDEVHSKREKGQEDAGRLPDLNREDVALPTPDKKQDKKKLTPGPGTHKSEIKQIIDSLFYQLWDEGKTEFLQPKRVEGFLEKLNERSTERNDSVSKEYKLHLECVSRKYKLKETLPTYPELIEWVRPKSKTGAILLKNPRIVRKEGLKKQPYSREYIKKRLYYLTDKHKEILSPEK